MKLIHRWFVFTAGWTNGQLAFLAIFAAFWCALAFYEAHRYDVARDAAIYWQQRALDGRLK